MNLYFNTGSNSHSTKELDTVVTETKKTVQLPKISLPFFRFLSPRLKLDQNSVPPVFYRNSLGEFDGKSIASCLLGILSWSTTTNAFVLILTAASEKLFYFFSACK